MILKLQNLPKKVRWPLGIIVIYIFVATTAPFLANHKPIIAKSSKGLTFPAFSSIFKSSFMQEDQIYEWQILPLIPYGPQKTDQQCMGGKSPVDQQNVKSIRYFHWLGTDKLGRDVASGLIHGTSVAILIGFISIFFSFIIGVSAGMIAAYYKNEGIVWNISQIISIIFTGSVGIFYSLNEWSVHQNFYIAGLLIPSLTFLTSIILYKIFDTKKATHISVSFDSLLIKIIELRKSFPGIFLLLALTSIFKTPSIWNIIIIITLLGWIEFARFARAETLSLKEENYILNSKLLGFNHLQIIFRHILPNILPTLIVVACFSVSSAILLESTLSFLGIGLPVEQVTWGKMMSDGRDMRAWWLVVFPGIALFVIILCLNTIAEKLSPQ